MTTMFHTIYRIERSLKNYYTEIISTAFRFALVFAENLSGEAKGHLKAFVQAARPALDAAVDAVGPNIENITTESVDLAEHVTKGIEFLEEFISDEDEDEDEDEGEDEDNS